MLQASRDEEQKVEWFKTLICDQTTTNELAKQK